jgi:hypothetical protein
MTFWDKEQSVLFSIKDLWTDPSQSYSQIGSNFDLDFIG